MGSLFLSLIITATLFGFTTFQVLTFLYANEGDPLLQKLSVIILWALDLAELSFFAHLVYYLTFVPNVPRLSVVWSFPIYLLIHKVLLFLTHGCYILRIWRMRPHRRCLPLLLLLFAVSNFGVGIYLSTLSYKISSSAMVSAQPFRGLVITTLSLSSATDLLIAGSLIYALSEEKLDLSWTNSSWVMLSAYFVNSGMMVGLISLTRVISYTIMGFRSLTLTAIVAELHVLSFVGMLNARLYFQKYQQSVEPDKCYSDCDSVNKRMSPTPIPALTINEVGLPLFLPSGQSAVNKVDGVEIIKVKVDKTFASDV